MMIAAVRVVKNSGADDDGRTHAKERDKASQYPEHCKPPIVCFFEKLLNAAIVSIKMFIVHRLPVIGDDVLAYYPELSCRRVGAAVPQLRGV